MKARKWIIFVGMLLAFFIMARVLLRYTELPQLANRFVLHQLQPLLGKNAKIESVKIGLGSLTLKNLTFSDANIGLSLKIHRTRFNLGIFNLLLYGMKSLNLVEEIQINDWDLEYKPIKFSGGKIKIDRLQSLALWKFPQNFPSIKKVNFTHGRIKIEPWQFQEIYGWIDLDNPEHLIYDVSAGLMTDSTNLRVQGNIFPAIKSLTANLEIEQGAFPDHWELFPDLEVIDGAFNVSTEANFMVNQIRLKGKIILTDLNLVYQDSIDFHSEKLSLDLSGDSVYVTGKGDILDLSLNLRGRLSNITSPVLDFTLESKRLDVGKVFKKLNSYYKTDGFCDLKFQVRGSWSHPEFSFQGSSNKISYEKIDFRNIRLEGKLSSGKIGLSSLDFKIAGGKVNGSGDISLTSDQPLINLEASYKGRPSLSEFLTNNYNIPLDSLYISANIQGALDDPLVEGNFTLNPSEKIKKLSGKYYYQTLKADFQSQSGAGDTLNLFLDFTAGTPEFTIYGINLHRILNPSLLPGFLNSDATKTNLEASGDFKNFNFNLTASDLHRILNLSAEVSRSEAVNLYGNFEFIDNDSVSTQGDISFQLKGDTLTLENFTSGEGLYAWGKADMKTKRIIDFEARSENFPLDRLLSYTRMKNWREYQGEVKFNIKAKGDFKNPQSDFSCFFSQGKLYKTDGYWSSLTGSMKDLKIDIGGFDFGNWEKTLFSGHGFLDLQNHTFDFRSSRNSVDVDLLINSVFGKKGLISGSGDYTIQATGSWDNPYILAGFRVGKGKAFKIPFDQLTGGLILMSDSSSLLKLDISSIKLMKQGGYDITLQGSLPLSNGEVNLQSKAQGKLLSILPYISSEVTKGEGVGTMELGFGGNFKALRLKSAIASIDNGTLELKTVVDKIENLNLRACLEDNFIHIYRLSGEIEKVPFIITTIPQVNTSHGALQPWNIGSTGLSLGIITLETPQGGLKMNLPNFIEAGETALLSVAGKEEDEKPYIAGPEEHPQVRAKLIVRDGAICYPPKEEKRAKKEKTGTITKLLKKINWDLEVIPDRGNTYIRDMSGMVEEPVLKNITELFSRETVELDIDKQLEGFKLQGSLNDTTLRMSGGLISTRGTVSFLDLDFRVQEFKIEFDPNERLPWVEGYATTTYRDSLGREFNITLRLAHIDPITGEKTYRAKWGDFTFVLEDDMGDSQEQILSYLGYATYTLGEKMTGVPLNTVDKAVFGDWLAKLEREIKNVSGLDYINIDPAVAQNLLEERLMSPTQLDTINFDWRTRYLRRSRFSLGKYITDDLFFTYSGRFDSGEDPADQRRRLRIIHSWNLEYRLPTKRANLLMVMSYQYDNLLKKFDKSVSIRYSFYF